MSLKKYMVYDLLMLGTIGAVLEGFCVWCSFYALVGNIASSVLSVLIVFTAIIRWKWWGLTITPLLALGSFIGGMFTDYNIYEKYNNFFDFKYYVAILLGLLSIGLLCLLIFKKDKFQESISNLAKVEGYAVLSFLLYEIVKHISYFVIQGQNAQAQATVVYDCLGFVILLIGVFVLNRQGFLLNVKQKLIDDRKDQEEEDKHEKFDL